MAINIPSLFRDVIETPEQRQQRQMLERLGQAQSFMAPRGSVAALANPLAGATFMNIAESQDRVKENLGGMLGLDMRDTSQKVSDELLGADLSSPQGMRDLSKAISPFAPAQAIGLIGSAQQQELLNRQKELEDLKIEELEEQMKQSELNQLAQKEYRESVYQMLIKDERLAPFADGVRNGSTPRDRVEKLVDQLAQNFDPKDLSIVQAFVNGQHRTLHTDGFGNYFSFDGSKITLDDNDKVTTASATGSFEDVSGLTQEIKDDLRNQQISTFNFISSANNIISALEENPDLNTAVAKIAGGVDDLLAESAALLRTVAPDVSTDIEKYKGVLDEVGLEGSRFRSATFGLALQYAAASGLGEGRSLTDADIERAIRAIGSDRSDAAAIIGVLKDKNSEVENRFRGAYRIQTGQEFRGNIDGRSRISDELFK